MAISGIGQCVKKPVKEDNQIELTESQSQRTTDERTSESLSHTIPKVLTHSYFNTRSPSFLKAYSLNQKILF
jgi:hypothetical protein